MGGSSSSLRPEELEEMGRGTNFSHKEIKRLYRRFKKLDKDDNGAISKEEFLMIPELAVNPLSKRIIEIFDENQDSSVNFKEFISTLSVFNAKGDRQEKMEFAFKLYDIDRDGFISNSELFEVLKMIVGDNLKDVQLQQIVDKTIQEADTTGDGKISFSEFCKLMADQNLWTKMSISFSSLLP